MFKSKGKGLKAFKPEVNSLDITAPTNKKVEHKRDTIKHEQEMAMRNNEREMKMERKEVKPKKISTNSLKDLKREFDSVDDVVGFLREKKDIIKALTIKQQKDFIDFAKNRYY